MLVSRRLNVSIDGLYFCPNYTMDHAFSLLSQNSARFQTLLVTSEAEIQALKMAE